MVKVVKVVHSDLQDPFVPHLRENWPSQEAQQILPALEQAVGLYFHFPLYVPGRRLGQGWKPFAIMASTTLSMTLGGCVRRCWKGPTPPSLPQQLFRQRTRPIGCSRGRRASQWWLTSPQLCSRFSRILRHRSPKLLTSSGCKGSAWTSPHPTL